MLGPRWSRFPWFPCFSPRHHPNMPILGSLVTLAFDHAPFMLFRQPKFVRAWTGRRSDGPSRGIRLRYIQKVAGGGPSGRSVTSHEFLLPFSRAGVHPILPTTRDLRKRFYMVDSIDMRTTQIPMTLFPTFPSPPPPPPSDP